MKTTIKHSTFFLLLSFIIGAVFGQETIQIISPANQQLSLKVGDAPVAVTLQVTNTGPDITSSAPRTIRISSSQTGIFVRSGSGLPSGVLSSDDPLNAFIDFTISSLSSGTNIQLPVTVQAGYCVSSTSSVQLSNIFQVNGSFSEITGNNLQLTVSPATSNLADASSQNKVYRNGTGLGTEAPTVTGIPMTTNADLNDIIIRDYVLYNSSSNGAYNGFAVLDGPDNFSSVSPTNLEVFIYDPNQPTSYPGTLVSGSTIDLASWKITVPVQVPPGYQLIYRETLHVNGCLSQNSGLTPINISWGVSEGDNCSPTFETIVPNLTPITGIHFTIDEVNSNYLPDLTCLADNNSSNHKNVIWVHDGQATAFNNIFSLLHYSRYSYGVPKESVKLSIKRNGESTKTYYDIDWSANQILQGYALTDRLTYDQFVALYPDPNIVDFVKGNIWINDTNSRSIYEIKNTLASRGAYERSTAYSQYPLIYNFSLTYKDFMSNYPYPHVPYSSACLPQQDNTEIIFNAAISHYFDDGNSVPIVLAPGDVIELEWDEYGCCLFQYSQAYFTGLWPYSFSTDICGNIHYPGSYSQSMYYQSSMGIVQDPGDSNISGEIDRCNSTSDGQIENVSFKVSPFGISQTTKIDDFNGKVLFKVYLDDGLDLDLSFESLMHLGLHIEDLIICIINKNAQQAVLIIMAFIVILLMCLQMILIMLSLFRGMGMLLI